MPVRMPANTLPTTLGCALRVARRQASQCVRGLTLICCALQPKTRTAREVRFPDALSKPSDRAAYQDHIEARLSPHSRHLVLGLINCWRLPPATCCWCHACVYTCAAACACCVYGYMRGFGFIRRCVLLLPLENGVLVVGDADRCTSQNILNISSACLAALLSKHFDAHNLQASLDRVRGACEVVENFRARMDDFQNQVAGFHLKRNTCLGWHKNASMI